MEKKQVIPIDITGIDSLGQGVSKASGDVTFVPKTAPGDRGEAEVVSKKKSVTFAKLLRLDQPSSLRIDPICPHFKDCSSCHFLHVDYSNELKFKHEGMKRLFRHIPLPEIEIVSAPRRLGYRNRVQLHFSVKSKLLGYREPHSHRIVPVPNCMIALPEVEKELRRLYQDQQWLKEVPKNLEEGHVEIYLHHGSVKTIWNKGYAAGGFTQVFGEMNSQLKERLFQELQSEAGAEVLDLFAGDGNLSNRLPHSKRLGVDVYEKVPGEDFLSVNLYDKGALGIVKRKLKERDLRPSILLLDPPRSGMRDLETWLKELKPRTVAYVSCDPHTMARDLQTVSGYAYKKALMFDFFPSTFHFETMVILERKT
jgi:23S rRNA (uracil1939-C5)-methyltransferase